MKEAVAAEPNHLAMGEKKVKLYLSYIKNVSE